MMMILKSMGVEVNKSDMDNYASEVDEEETGKFTFMMFCQVGSSNIKIKSTLIKILMRKCHFEGGRQVYD